MASNPQAAQLTEAYRRSALTLRAAALRDLSRLWPALDVRDLSRTWPVFETALTGLVNSHRRQVAGLASAYLRRFRELEGVGGDLTSVLADTVDLDQLTTSLRVTGPVTIDRALQRGLTATAASDLALTTVAGAISRHILNGGRDTIMSTVQADEKALGYMRIVRGRSCAFCAMLASRGPVYKTAEPAGARGSATRYHDHCDCSVEPVYSRHTVLPASSRRAQQVWAESTGGKSGAAARAAFRAAYAAL